MTDYMKLNTSSSYNIASAQYAKGFLDGMRNAPPAHSGVGLVYSQEGYSDARQPRHDLANSRFSALANDKQVEEGTQADNCGPEGRDLVRAIRKAVSAYQTQGKLELDEPNLYRIALEAGVAHAESALQREARLALVEELKRQGLVMVTPKE